MLKMFTEPVTIMHKHCSTLMTEQLRFIPVILNIKETDVDNSMASTFCKHCDIPTLNSRVYVDNMFTCSN
jgi:hypothetical protein